MSWGPITLDNVILYNTKLRNPTQVATMTTALDLGVNRRSEEKCYKVQDTIVYDSNLDRVPWVVSTISCPQDSASFLSSAVLLIKSSYLLKVSCRRRFCPIINVVIFPAIRLNSGIFLFLSWPIREILSLYFLPNRTKVLLCCFCYSARYQYPYFQLSGSNRDGKHR